MPELITLTMKWLSNKLSRVVIETLVKKASWKYLVRKFSSRSGRVVNSNGSMMTLPSISDPNQAGHNNLRSSRDLYKKDGFLVHFNYQIKSEHSRRLEGLNSHLRDGYTKACNSSSQKETWPKIICDHDHRCTLSDGLLISHSCWGNNVME